MSRLIFSALCASLLAITQAPAAVNLAGGLSYTNDFSNLNDFTGTTKWANTAVFSGGATSITTQGSDFQAGTNVANSSTGKNPGNSATPFTPTFPLNPIVTSTSYNSVNSGFSGNWLISQANGNVYNNTTDSWSSYGSTALTLENIGAHTNLSLSVLIAAGDSIDSGRTQSDGSTNSSYDGPLQILINGQIVFERRFSGGGVLISGGTNNQGFINGATGTITSTTNLNASSSYLENWADNSGAGPLNENNRGAASWTLDSAHTLNLNLAHTSSTATIEFRHYISSAVGDEFLALDRLQIFATPEPTRALLLLTAAIGLTLPRRRQTRPNTGC